MPLLVTLQMSMHSRLHTIRSPAVTVLMVGGPCWLHFPVPLPLRVLLPLWRQAVVEIT